MSKKGSIMKSSIKRNDLLLKRIERQHVMTLGLLKEGLSVLSLERGNEILERRTKFVLSTTLSLLTSLRRRCRNKKKVDGHDAKLFLLGLKWAAVGFMVSLGHRFYSISPESNHRDVVAFIRRSLSLFNEIIRSARFAIGVVNLPIVYEKGVSSVMFRFLYEMRINQVIPRMLAQANNESTRDEVLKMIPLVDNLEAVIEDTHDRTVEVDGSVLAFVFKNVVSKKRESVRKKATVS